MESKSVLRECWMNAWTHIVPKVSNSRLQRVERTSWFSQPSLDIQHTQQDPLLPKCLPTLWILVLTAFSQNILDAKYWILELHKVNSRRRHRDHPIPLHGHVEMYRTQQSGQRGCCPQRKNTWVGALPTDSLLTSLYRFKNWGLSK